VFQCFAGNMQLNSRSFTNTFRDFVLVLCELCLSFLYSLQYDVTSMQCFFFLGGRRGTVKHFVNLTGESKNFKILEFPLNQLQTYYGYLCDLCPLTAFIFSDLNHKYVIFLSQTESTP
jgi:hypothetical protein